MRDGVVREMVVLSKCSSFKKSPSDEVIMLARRIRIG